MMNDLYRGARTVWWWQKRAAKNMKALNKGGGTTFGERAAANAHRSICGGVCRNSWCVSRVVETAREASATRRLCLRRGARRQHRAHWHRRQLRFASQHLLLHFAQKLSARAAFLPPALRAAHFPTSSPRPPQAQRFLRTAALPRTKTIKKMTQP